MRRYLLDTGPLTALFFSRPAVVALVAPWLRREETATSLLVYITCRHCSTLHSSSYNLASPDASLASVLSWAEE